MNIPYDKKLHFGYSFAIAVIAGLAGNALGMNWLQALFTGAGVSLAAGFGKEYGDKVNPNERYQKRVKTAIVTFFIAFVIALTSIKSVNMAIKIEYFEVQNV